MNAPVLPNYRMKLTRLGQRFFSAAKHAALPGWACLSLPRPAAYAGSLATVTNFQTFPDERNILIPGWLEKAYWWAAKRMYGIHRVGDIDLLFMSADNQRTAADIEIVLTRSLNLISAAKGGFGELVTSHLKLVVAVDAGQPYVSRHARAYVSHFHGPEATNGQYLACQLIWAATFIRLSRDAVAHRVKPDLVAIREFALASQLRFVRQFPESDTWSSYLLANRPDTR
jgi:hypothetical protein